MCTFMIYGTTPGLPLALSGDSGLLLDARAQNHESAGDESPDEPSGIGVERRLRKICSDNGGLIYMTTTFDHESLVRFTRINDSQSAVTWTAEFSVTEGDAATLANGVKTGVMDAGIEGLRAAATAGRRQA